MAKPRVLRVEQETQLLPFLQESLRDQKRTKLKQLLKHGCVTVNGRAARRHDHLLVPGNEVRVEFEKKMRPESVLPPGFRVEYEDDEFLVIHKPAGMLSVPVPNQAAETALGAVNAYLTAAAGGRRRQAQVVHRLDKHTSGLLVFAKTARARAFFLDRWRRVEKIYLALVEGKPDPPTGTLRSYLKEERDMKVHTVRETDKGDIAVTRYRVVNANNHFAVVECRLDTGRKNQIRVQLAELGHPIVGDVGDRKYGSRRNPCGRLGLHAWRMRIPHPTTGKVISVESEYPDLLARILRPKT